MGDILKKSKEGRMVLALQGTPTPLPKPSKQLLKKAVIDYFIQCEQNMSIQQCVDLAAQIEKYFPGESKVKSYK